VQLEGLYFDKYRFFIYVLMKPTFVDKKKSHGRSAGCGEGDAFYDSRLNAMQAVNALC
jgi:hypothetical protein